MIIEQVQNQKKMTTEIVFVKNDMNGIEWNVQFQKNIEIKYVRKIFENIQR